MPPGKYQPKESWDFCINIKIDFETKNITKDRVTM